MGRKKNGASLADAMFSQNGEQNPNEEISYIPQQVEYVPQVEEKDSGRTIYKLVNNNRNGRVHIHGEDVAINPKTGLIDTIHLLRGENEIWGSELKKMYPTNFKDIVKNRREDLIFENRVLVVPNYDVSANEFLKYTKNHIEAPNRKTGGKTEFFIYNPLRQAQEADRKAMVEMDCLEKLFKLDEPTVKKLSVYLNIPLSDALGEPKPLAILRKDLGLRAKQDPEGFLQLFGDKAVDLNYLIIRAIRDSKIDVSMTNGKLYWATGAIICSVTGTDNAKDALLNLALSATPAGEDFVEQLKKVVAI